MAIPRLLRHPPGCRLLLRCTDSRKTFSILLLALLLVSSALGTRLSAATYYSDPTLGATGNSGSSASPWPSLSVMVSSGMLSLLHGGDILLLRSGNHGTVTIAGTNPDLITIAAAPGAVPQLARLTVNGKNWLIRGLTISVSFATTAYTGYMVSLGESSTSSNLTIQDCFIYGGLDHTGWTVAQWMLDRNGILLGRNGRNLTARNNYLLNLRFGIAVTSFNSLVEGNVISDFSADGIRLTRDGSTTRGNVIKNCYVSAADGDANHDDGIQCFLFNVGTGTIRNFTISDNIVINHENFSQALPNDLQGIDCFDGPAVNFTVTGNVVRSWHYHGVSFYDPQGCNLSDNACWNDSANGRKTWVMYGTKQHLCSEDNIAMNNMALSYDFASVPNPILANNTLSTAATFQAKQDQLLAQINAEFGQYHPVSGFARLGTTTGTNAVARAAITSFSPTSGGVGTSVTITGSSFTGATAVGFNNTVATFSVVSATTIIATVPSGAITGPITVATPGGTAASLVNFTVTGAAAPTITSFTPTIGPGVTGATSTNVIITGSNFTGATAVTFNGLAAVFDAQASVISATVPVGATTGKISVTTPGGTVTSTANFTVTAALPTPTITSFSPTSGGVGTGVTITGSNFTGATSVTFHGVPAAFAVVSATKITTTVPVGATTGKVTVSNTSPSGYAISAASFTVTGPVNHAPVANAQAVTTAEDTAKAITLVATDADGNALTYVIVANPTHGTLSGSGTARTYTPAANYNGADSFTFKANDGTVDSNTATVSLTVTAVNDVPSFTKGANQTVLEDSSLKTVTSWATAITKGPADEAAQTLNCIVTNTNNALFSVQPAVSATGTLTFTPAANANGSATVSVSLHDSGGTANGGADTSAVQTFTITLTAVNDVPSFTKGANQTVLEDSGLKTVTGWATAISKGPADEAAQALNCIVTNTNNALFSVQPAVSATGTLTFTPAANANGLATVSVSLHDNGGTANGGVDTSAVQTFTITLTAVNDPPSFTKGADQTVLQDSTLKTVAGWATAISKGPADEAAQTLNFIVSNTNNALFSVQPAVSATGTLTFTPATGATGMATVSVSLHDSGGTANGGVDTSAVQTVTITVLTPGNHAPVVAVPIPDQAAFAGAAFTYIVPAGSFTDVDGDTLTWSASGLPAWLTFTAATRTFSGTPAAGDVGTPSMTVTVKDPSLATASDAFILTVSVDITPPAQPAAPTVSGSNPALPTLSGTTEPGVTMKVYDGAVLVGTVLADGSGAWTWTPAVPLTSGTHILTVVAVDAAGNASVASTGTTVVVPVVIGTVTSSGGGGGGGGCGAGGFLSVFLLPLVGLRRRNRRGA